jgi:D-cysteine desulfhydrase
VALPLTARYPGTAALPLAGIAELPTPLEALGDDGLLRSARVKRDDLTSAEYGGNKVRKLDFLLGQALAEGRRSVLTFGAYGSNHALATALYARRLGLEPHVVLSPQDPGPFAPRTLLAHARLGTVIHLTEGWDGRREAVRAKQQLEARDGVGPFVIPMGGTAPLGVVGFVNAALEVAEQAGAQPPDAVYAAAGTLGTAVGLAIGFAALGLPTRVEAIGVTPVELRDQAVVERLVGETVSLVRSYDPHFPYVRSEDLRLRLRDEFFAPGYGIVTPQTTEATELARRSGLHLETTYTGKAYAAMVADARAGLLEGRTVLFWDTYSSAPYPEPGDPRSLPAELRAYIDECRRLYPDAWIGGDR